MRNVIGRAFALTVIAVLSLGFLSSLVWCDEIILSEHVELISIDSPDSRAYQFNLAVGDMISISISVLGDSINLYIYNSTVDELLQRTNIITLEEQWTVPSDDTFEFIIETFAGENAQAIVDITIYRTHTLDNVPPEIDIISPENKTYNTSSVPLTFAVNEPASWIGYSLDNEANITITGNTTLTALPEGAHHITVYAEDASGNTGSSDTVYFTVSTPLPLHDIAVTSIVPSSTEVYEGASVNITVAIKNNGNSIETFNVTTYANTTTIQTQTVSNLVPDTQTTLLFVWNTTGFYLGNYTIKAEASIVHGETHVSDNVEVNGVVHVIPESPLLIILSPLLITTLLAVMAYRRKDPK